MRLAFYIEIGRQCSFAFPMIEAVEHSIIMGHTVSGSQI